MKKNSHSDITRTVISGNEMTILAEKIFPDSVVLDRNLNIFSSFENLGKTLGYANEEFQNTPFKDFLSSPIEIESIKNKLVPGFFDKYQIKLKCKNGKEMLFIISGFYLGLISDINDLIVLKLQNMEELIQAKNQLEAKTIEMDDFVYHSAHSLRGPLATLKGLIGLAKLTNDKEDLDELTHKMNQFVECLDDKLSTLLKYAGFKNGEEHAKAFFTFDTLSERLKICLENELINSNVHFRNKLHAPDARIDKGKLVLEVLINLVSFLLRQNNAKGSEIVLESTGNKAFIELRLHTFGISINEEHKNKLENTNFGYVEILNDTQFAGLYSAKKFIQKINGNIKMIFPNENEMCAILTIPKVFYNPAIGDSNGTHIVHVLN